MESSLRLRTWRRQLISLWKVRRRVHLRTFLLVGSAIFVISFVIRALTAQDMIQTMYTVEQPLNGITKFHHLRAESILRGEGFLGPPNQDVTNTCWLAQGPGYSFVLAGVYRFGSVDFFTVQIVQNVLNSLGPVLLFLITAKLVSMPVGAMAGFFAAFSQYLSYFSNYLLPDSLVALPMLLAIYLLVILRRYRHYTGFYVALAGGLSGLSVWLRPQGLLLGPFLGVLILVNAWPSPTAFRRSLIMTVFSLLVVAPMTIHNAYTYDAFVPVSIGTGYNFLAGLADAGGTQFGVVTSDSEIARQEALLYNRPDYAQDWCTPNGIRRDQDRVRKGWQIIRQRPLWYARSVIGRMVRMCAFAKEGSRILPTSQWNARRPIAPFLPWAGNRDIESTALAFTRYLDWLRIPLRTVQQMIGQSVVPCFIVGAIVLWSAAPKRAALLFAVPLYYLVFQSLLHTELRYTMPMQYFVLAFASIPYVLVFAWLARAGRRFAGGHAR